MKISRGGSENFYTPERGALKKLGGSANLYTSNSTGCGGGGWGLLKNWTTSEGGLLKFQASSLNIFIPPPPHPLVTLNELSLASKQVRRPNHSVARSCSLWLSSAFVFLPQTRQHPTHRLRIGKTSLRSEVSCPTCTQQINSLAVRL